MAKKTEAKKNKAELLVEIRAEAEAKAEKFTEYMQSGEHAEEAQKLDAEMQELVGRYTDTARDKCFEECAEADDPVIAAAEKLSFTTINIHDGTVSDTRADGVKIKIPERTIVEKTIAIDLLKLHKFVEGGIGKDKNWNTMVEKFNYAMTCETARGLGINPKSISDSYAMSEVAREFELGKNPASKTQLLKTLNAITMALVGEGYKATTHDVNYLVDVYCKKKNSQKLTVSCASHNQLRAYVLDMLHRIVTNGKYNVSYKTKKNS